MTSAPVDDPMHPPGNDGLSELARFLARQFGQGRWYELLHVVANGEMTEADGIALVAYSYEKVNAIGVLASALGEPEDEPELYKQLAYHWLELRCEWCRYNQVIQYQMIRHGGLIDQQLAQHAGMAAAMLGWLEPLLDPADVTLLMEIAADPLAMSRNEKTSPGAIVGADRNTQVDLRVARWVMDTRLREAAEAHGRMATLVVHEDGMANISLRWVERLDQVFTELVGWLMEGLPGSDLVKVSVEWQLDEAGLVIGACADPPHALDPPGRWRHGPDGGWTWSAAVSPETPA